jgi:hypothetical protein
MPRLVLQEASVSGSSDSDSRYKDTKILNYNDGEVRMETTEKLIIDPADDDVYHQVDVGEENRLDLVAFRYYRNANLWWILATANNLNDPFVISIGMVIRIPSLNRIYGYKGILA